MAKVFVLTSGSYSDYSIVGVFSRKSKAQQAYHMLDIYSKNENIEEYELDALETLVNKFSKGYSIYRVTMKRDGTTSYVRKNDGIQTFINHSKSIGELWGNVLAKSDQHAVKIVNEKRTQLIASGEL